MFDKLREKLQIFKKSVEEKQAAPAAPAAARDTPAAEKKVAPAEPEAVGEKPAPEKKIGFGDKVRALVLEQELFISEKDLEEPLWELQMALLESDVALPVAEEIVGLVKKDILGTRRKIGMKVGSIAGDALRNSLRKILSVNRLDFDAFIKGAKRPTTIVFVGVNGTGKTTSIAKVGEYLKSRGYSLVIAAADTFRAGATEQIEKHAENIGIKVIKHQEGADPAAVVYDAVEHAKARKKDIVLVDTAGRMHTNVNLMDQLKKICRVVPPDLILFVDEAIAGNDAVERGKMFNDAISFHGSILTKADADAKGGAAISIAHTTGKPILFLGVGQKYSDLMKFDPDWLVDKLLE
ncbi:MAG TPA: signal recognition particle-docking protein FtsY [Candidatus Methanoperedenaceae archaeon]|nr:signal recognition particle-docking protein FtsY [Candidatus Methanoperedenaceae archaeon]